MDNEGPTSEDLIALDAKLQAMRDAISSTKPSLRLPRNAITQLQFNWLNSLKTAYGRVPWKVVLPMFQEENPGTYCTLDLIDHRFRSEKIGEHLIVDVAELRRRRDALNAEIAKAEMPPSAIQRPRYGKFVTLFDIHFGVDELGDNVHLPLDSVLKFLKDFKPNVFIFGGDAMDAATCSHWLVGNARRQKQLPFLKDYYTDFNTSIVNPIKDAVGDSCYIVFLEGNHEFWIRKAIDETPNGQGFWEIEHNIEGIDEFIPYDMSMAFKLGKLYTMHGDKFLKYHAQAIASSYLRAVRYGHVHDIQTFTQKNALDIGDYHIASSCGCMCKKAASWNKNRPSSYVNAFNYGVVEESGMYYDFIPVLNPDLSFRAEGVKYSM